MKNYIKRISAVLTAILLCYAVLPVFSYADEKPQLVTSVIDGVSEYGLQYYHYEDSDGNVIEPQHHGYVRDVTSSAIKTRRSGSLPSSYNSNTQGYITTVKSQGNMGNCWSFASIGCMEAYAVKHMNAPVNTTDYSEAHLTWYASSVSQDQSDLMYGDGLNYPEPYTYGGNAGMAALCFARGSGVALESDYPFNGSDASQMGNYNDTTARYEHNIGLLDSSNSLSLESDIKQAIIDNGGVETSYYHSDSYINHDGPYTYSDGTPAPYYCSFAAYYCDTVYQSNHSVMVVGWDDNYSKNNFKSGCQPSSDGAWICKNSWGDTFGVGGYFWISYEDATLDGFNTFTMSTDYDYVSAYSGACNASWYTLSSDTKMANIFTSEGERTLEAAGFLLKYDNVPVTVKVYKGMAETPSSPVNGSPVATASGTFREGYNTIKFASPVSLNTGERFSIVVEMPAVNGQSCLPVESSYGQCVNGTSYIYYNGRWRNCYSDNCGSTYVYAYTNEANQSIIAQNISIDQISQSVYAGQTLQLSATVLPAETDNPNVLWSSSDINVATVDSNGLVNAVSEGTAVITASTTDGSNLTDSITVTVLDNHFTITYLVDGEQYQVQTYAIGDNVVPPASPQKTGYTFLYWNPSYPETMPAQNLTVSAIFQIKQYLVRTIVDSVETSSHYYDYETVINEPSHTEKTGYVFNGWNNSSGESVSFPFTLTQNTDLIASYSPATDTAYRLEIYRMDTEGVYPDTPESVEVYTGTTDERVSVNYIVPEGFTLDRISNLSGIVSGDGSLVLKAYLNRRTYTITVVYGDENLTYTYYYGQAVESVSVSAPEGYLFAGCLPQIPATMPAENLTVTPVFVEHVSKPSISIVTTNELNLRTGDSVTVYVAIKGGNSSDVIWSVRGKSLEITPSYDGRSCVVTAVKGGSSVITASLVSSAGNILSADSVKVNVSAGTEHLFNKIMIENSGVKFRLIVSLFELIEKIIFEFI